MTHQQEQTSIRKLSIGPRAFIPLALLADEVTINDVRVYACVSSYIGMADNVGPTFQQIMEDANLESLYDVERSVRKLVVMDWLTYVEDYGLITKVDTRDRI